MADDWASHARAAIPQPLRDRWGWSNPFRVRERTTLRRPTPTDTLVIDASGLTIPYNCGTLVLDFGARTLRLWATDQKTPSEEHWDVDPPPEWWDRALELEWPL